MISLRAAPGVRAGVAIGHLTPLEIVEQTMVMAFVNRDMYPNSDRLARGFADSQRDFANERLLMWGTDIIDMDGHWGDDFIGGSDIVLERYVPVSPEYPQYPGGHTDTIAYIRNATLRAARAPMKAAYDRGDYATVYKLFDTAFTFEPITGPEWRELKAKGEN